MSTGSKLKALIKKSGMKQIQLANMLEISASRLSNYLSGKREMELDMLERMARILEVDLNYFASRSFTQTEQPEPEPPAGAICIPLSADVAKTYSTPSEQLILDDFRHYTPKWPEILSTRQSQL